MTALRHIDGAFAAIDRHDLQAAVAEFAVAGLAIEAARLACVRAPVVMRP